MFYKIINPRKKLFTKAVDIIGYTLWFPLSLLHVKEKCIESEDINNILVIRTAYVGDVIMTLPVLKPLRDMYPDAKITFLTTSNARAILKNNPYIDEVLEYDAFWFYESKSGSSISDYLSFLETLRSREYDLVIEARADIRDIFFLVFMSRSRYRISYSVGGGGYLLTHVVPFNEIKHKVQYHLDILRYLLRVSCPREIHKVQYHLDILRYLGASSDDIDWGIVIADEEMASSLTLLSNEGIKQSDLVIGIHPGGRKELKSWLKEGFAEVADRLISEQNASIIFTGSNDEKRLVDDITQMMKHKAVNLAGRMDIRTLCAIMKRYDLFICNDTAPLHLASAMKTPTVAIFGPSKSNETGPFGNVYRVVEKDYPCRYTCDEDVCNHNIYNECMKAVRPDDVYNAVVQILRSGKAATSV